MDNNKRCTNGSQTTFTSDITAGDIVGFRLDLDNNELSISVNGTDKGKVYDIQGGVTYTPAQQGYTTSSKAVLNCGQDSTFIGAVSSGGNTDENGIGDFKYAVPSGYKAICSANLPDPTILLPNKHFDNLLWTGDGNDNRNITGLNFQPDWVWIKERSSTSGHVLTDSVRGIPAVLESNTTGPEDTSSGAADIVQSFNSDGFQVGTSGRVNQSGQTNVGWNWNAGDTDGKTYAVTVVSDSGNKYRFDGFGTSAVTLDLAEGGTYIFDQSDSSNAGHPLRFSTTSNGTHGGGSEYTTGVTTAGTPGSSGAYTQIVVAASAPTLYYYCTQHSGMGGAINTNSTLGSSNFDGSIQSTVKANASSGFSIGLFTGTGSNASIGHGLGVAPSVVIAKSRSHSDNWFIYHKSLGANAYIMLNSTSAADTGNSTVWQNVSPTSSVFYASTGGYNDSGQNLVFYAFSEVAGYSKFGSYTGNGSSDGTFVFTGFRPAWVMIKRTSGTQNWRMFDNKRNPFNDVDLNLQANTSGAEFESSAYNALDFLSNGFKLVGTNADEGTNQNGQTYVYFAFAEAPFKNARAR